MDGLSVIIPIYNAEKSIHDTVTSVLHQTYKDIEVLLIDDGSTDSSLKICDKLAQKDERIFVIHKKNGGVSEARNIGLDKAQGQYIAFVDSDDLLECDMYEVLLNDMKLYNADISMCGVVVEKSYHAIEQKPWKAEVTTNPLELLMQEQIFAGSIWNKVFKREVIGNLCFDKTISYSEDHLFMTRIFMKAKKVSINPKKLYHYMQHSDSLSWKDGDYNIWQGNFKARKMVYEEVMLNKCTTPIIRYAFEEYAKSIIALLRFAVKYRKKDEYYLLKQAHEQTISQYIHTFNLSIGKKLEYETYLISYAVASLVHYYFKGSK